VQQTIKSRPPNQISGDFGWVLADIKSLAEQCLIKVDKDIKIIQIDQSEHVII
jgi:hypothetical protein